MRRLAAVVLSAVVGLCLTSCAQPPLWQVVGIYTDPSLPDELPARADLSFHNGRLAGSTECASLQGTYELGQEQSREVMRIQTMEFADPGACIGGARYVHDALASVLVAGAEFELIDVSETEKLLRSTASLGAPSVRLMML